jgi:endonuclease/exonuclease/phosphatase family metal-dependent hydrolase
MFAKLSTDLQAHKFRWFFAALTMAFGLQELRVLFLSFVGYLRDSVGMASLELAPIAVGIFALALLSGVLNRVAGSRTALWITAGGLGVLRIAEQLSNTATGDLWLSAAATALFLMWLPLGIGIARARGYEGSVNFAFGLLLGLSLDSAISIGLRTLDLSWQPGLIGVGITLVLVALQLWSMTRLIGDAPAAVDGTWLSSLALLAIGPWLFLQLMLFQNTALFSSLSWWETPVAGGLVLLGNAVGLWMAAGTVYPRRSWVNVALVGLLMLVPMWMAFKFETYPGLFLFLSQVFSVALGFFLFLAAARVKGKPGLLRSTLFAGVGQILFVLLTFIYYASYDIDFGIRSGMLPPVAGVLVTIFVTIAFLAKQDASKDLKVSRSPALVAACLLVVPLLLGLTWAKPGVVATNSKTITVMDYNLHDAVNTDGRVDPEALAQVIEASGADIVGLQEISRGWLIWGGMDMLTWLSQRLDMPYIWGPTADAQWGNAILSRFPILSVENLPLPPEEVLLLRGYLIVEFDVDGTTLTFIDTHFSEKDGQDDIRAAQASVLLDAWAQRPATVIMGDLNALPDSLALDVLLGGGLIDISREIGEQPTYTYSSFAPDHQIDYILVSPDITFSDFHIPSTTASDHLPLVATITLP